MATDTRTQLHRPLGLASSALPPDALLVTSASITERLGQPFKIEITAVSEDPSLPFEKIVGQNVSLRFDQADGTERYWNGYVSSFNHSGMSGHLQQYFMQLVPWLWFLGRTADFRVYQDMTVPDIVKSIFEDGGFSGFVSWKLTGTYGKWENCVQYRETDLNFISRLMEQEGIYYYFEHENGKHTLVMCDAPRVHEPKKGLESIIYRPTTGGGEEDHEYIFDWTLEQRLQPGRYETMDYDFKNPGKLLKAQAGDPKKHAANDYEVFDYPGEWDEAGDGDHYTKMRLEELNAQHEIVHAVTNVRGLESGRLFKLEEYHRVDQNKQYLVTSLDYSLTLSDSSSSSGGGSADFHCRFTAIDAKTQFRPPRTTPKPVIYGPQTAIVTGPPGEEIHTDKYGRIKVQFHWDRYGKRNENSSCWMRVAQSWAGKKWGTMFIPRIGMEAIVHFIEGDPDCPIVTGCVYNGEQMPPYELPANATRSTMKSNSSKGGGGFNEIRFEDKKGYEQIFINAWKDLDLRVKHIEKEFVGASRHLIVGGDQYEHVGGEKHLTVDKDQYELVKFNLTQDVRMDLQQKVGLKHAIEAGLESHIKSDLNVVIEAGLMLTLKCGASFITLSPAGVTIMGVPLTLINSGGAAGTGSGCTVEEPKLPAAADKAEPGEKPPALKPPPPVKPTKYKAQAKVLKQAAKSGTPFCEKCAEAMANAAAGVSQGIEDGSPTGVLGAVGKGVAGVASGAAEAIAQPPGGIGETIGDGTQKPAPAGTGLPGLGGPMPDISGLNLPSDPPKPGSLADAVGKSKPGGPGGLGGSMPDTSGLDLPSGPPSPGSLGDAIQKSKPGGLGGPMPKPDDGLGGMLEDE